MDWGVFHVEPRFAFHWQRYHQALRQRNAALRARQAPAIIGAWDPELIVSGSFLSVAREAYISQLREVLDPLGSALLGEPIGLRYKTGWNRDLTLEEAIGAGLTLDRERGSTQVGPQRADLVVEFGGHRARERVSRGQQKMLAAALILAQLKMFANANAVPMLLLDDPAAELDVERLDRLIRQVRLLPVQLVVTSLTRDSSGIGEPGASYFLDEGHQIRRA